MGLGLLEQEKMRNIRVFSGSAHRELAREICDFIDVPLLPSVTRHFSNDCLYVHLGVSVREKEVFIIQPLVPPVRLVLPVPVPHMPPELKPERCYI